MDTKLEAIGLMRLLPAGAAHLGEGVTREHVRQAGMGPWSAQLDQREDLRGVLPPPELDGYDVVLPMEDEDDIPTEDAVVLRFGTRG